jgi:outer membrane protein assembly factor BamA
MGVRGEAQDYVMLEVEEGGLLDAGSAPGDHTAVAGAGILAFYDSRERRYSPRRGSYHQFFWLRFGSIDGRDYEFNVFNADFRWYIPVRLNDVLAIQLFTYITDEGHRFSGSRRSEAAPTVAATGEAATSTR